MTIPATNNTASSSSLRRPRPLSSHTQHAFDRVLNTHEAKQYEKEYMRRKNTKEKEKEKESQTTTNDDDNTTTSTTNIRNQKYQFRLSFDDWVALK